MNKNRIKTIITMLITLVIVAIFIKIIDFFLNIELIEEQSSQNLFIITILILVIDIILAYVAFKKIIKRK